MGLVLLQTPSPFRFPLPARRMSNNTVTELIGARATRRLHAERVVDGHVLDGGAKVPTSSGVVTVSGGFQKLLGPALALTDGQLALLVSTMLFVVGAWPLALTEVPPYQDLPNHLAAATVIQNPEKYPEFVFNGFLKTNTALFAWLFVAGKVVGVKMAARLFALLVLAGNALALPRLVLQLTGSRRKMVIASLFAWPMVHNWFVSMGMLDFAMGVPLSLALLLVLDRQRTKPTPVGAVMVTALGVVTWYAHVFPLLVVQMLAVIHVASRATWRERFEQARRLLLPLAPVAFVVLVSIVQHLRDTIGPMTAFSHQVKWIAPWELVYNLWAEWCWGFTKLSMMTVVPAILLGVFGFLRRKDTPAFFSPWALAALLALYAFTPYVVTNWYHVNSRFIPFIFFALLLRVPDRLPKQLLGLLAVCGVAYSAAMGADFVRLDKDRQRFVAGMNAVPEGARLLPLVFKHKGASDNTRSLLHAWGFYVTEKHTSAPLLFAHSRSFPVMYSVPPPIRFNHLVLESFATNMAKSDAICESIAPIIANDCQGEYRARWSEFWRDATPLYDHVLLWQPTPEALDQIPAEFKATFRNDDLVILQRSDYTQRGLSASTGRDDANR